MDVNDLSGFKILDIFPMILALFVALVSINLPKFFIYLTFSPKLALRIQMDDQFNSTETNEIYLGAYQKTENGTLELKDDAVNEISGEDFKKAMLFVVNSSKESLYIKLEFIFDMP